MTIKPIEAMARRLPAGTVAMEDRAARAMHPGGFHRRPQGDKGLPR